MPLVRSTSHEQEDEEDVVLNRRRERRQRQFSTTRSGGQRFVFSSNTTANENHEDDGRERRRVEHMLPTRLLTRILGAVRYLMFGRCWCGWYMTYIFVYYIYRGAVCC
jgi:hypothetical protein